MQFNLRTKLTAAITATALICVLLIGIFSNIQLEKHFKDYVQKNQETKNQEIVKLINTKLLRTDGLDPKAVEEVGVYALEQGLILQAWDLNGKSIWDAYNYNDGMCQQITQNMSKNMMSHYPEWQGQLMTKRFDLTRGTAKIGVVDISYYGPFYFTDSDLMFIKALNNIFIGVGLFSLLLAVVFGAFVAKRISTPITRVIKTAKAISEGNYEDRSLVKTSTSEISQLAHTVNDLAVTLERQEKLRKRLTGDVAHELRTPMATLQSHMEAMIDGIWEPTTERLTSCHEEITRITRLVSDLEKLAHYESENLILNKTKFIAAEWMTRLLQNYETVFGQKGVALVLDCDESELFADRDKLSQVMINLLMNALKFTPAGGTVTVQIKSEKAQCDIRVSDTGQGIADQDLPHIFERFYRGDVSRNRETGGSGIGLTLVKAIAEAHGGAVAVTSESNVGTTFSLTIPQ